MDKREGVNKSEVRVRTYLANLDELLDLLLHHLVALLELRMEVLRRTRAPQQVPISKWGTGMQSHGRGEEGARVSDMPFGRS